MYGTRSHFSKILLLTKACKPGCGRSETSSGREVVVGGNMEMQLFPVPFPNRDALLLIHKVARPTPNLPKTALIPVPAQRNLLRHPQKDSGIDSIHTKKVVWRGDDKNRIKLEEKQKRQEERKHLSIEPHAIGGEGRGDGDGGGGGEVVGVEGDADAVVDGEDEGVVAFAPVLNEGDVGGRSRRHHQHPILGSLPHLTATPTPPPQYSKKVNLGINKWDPRTMKTMAVIEKEKDESKGLGRSRARWRVVEEVEDPASLYAGACGREW